MNAGPLPASLAALRPTPTAPERSLRIGDFATLAEALDYAALQPTGVNLHAVRGPLAEVLPYRLLREQARGLAVRLLARGLVPGDRVALAASTDGEFLRAFFACQYAGLVPAPLPLPAPFGGREVYVSHVRRMLQGSRASAAIAPPDLSDWFLEAAADLDLRFAGSLEALSPFGGAEAGASDADLPPPDPQGLGLLQFSSGSTRFPMGVEISQAALIANAATTAGAGLKVTAADRAVSWLPLYHDMGLVGFLLMPMLCQMSVDLLPTAGFVRRPALWPGLISQNRASLSYSPTFGYDLAARRVSPEGLEQLDLSTWRVAGVGGDMLRPEPLRAFARAFASVGFEPSAFVSSYGMAEATLAVSMSLGVGLRTDSLDAGRLAREGVAVAPTRSGEPAREYARCGRPLAGHAMEVRDGAGAILGERRVGRIFVRGPSLMRGYFERPQETAQVLSADGWLDTGDLGYWSDGEIVITGRAKDLIVVNGRNLWPQDLEWTVEDALPELRTGDVAVFSVWSGSEEAVVALAECRSADEGQREALRGRIGDLLRARHGVNVEVALVRSRSLPMTSSGKLSRSRARDMYQAGAFQPLPEPAPVG